MKNEIITQYSISVCYKTESLGIRIGQVVNNIKSPWEPFSNLAPQNSLSVKEYGKCNWLQRIA